MKSGLERAPVYPTEPAEPWTDRQDESVMSFHLVAEHRDWLNDYLELDSAVPYRATARDLEARRLQLDFGKNMAHCTTRSVHELGKLVLGSVSDMEAEFERQTVLDIGCGEGRFGEKIARTSKARVTFVDKDPALLGLVSPRAGERVEADGRELPFADESFSRVMCAFSSLHWAETPVDTAQALNEALRVTQTGGSLILIPALANLNTKHVQANLIEELVAGGASKLTIDEQALKPWLLQDHVTIETLLKLADEGYCAITWSEYFKSTEIHHVPIQSHFVSAIVDKLKPIPAEFFAQNVAYAQSLIQSGAVTGPR